MFYATFRLTYEPNFPSACMLGHILFQVILIWEEYIAKNAATVSIFRSSRLIYLIAVV